MVIGCCSDVERFTERCRACACCDVAIDQHQQSRFLDGSSQHELDIGTANISLHGRLEPFTAKGITPEIRRNMQEEGVVKPFGNGHRHQLLHERLQH